MKRFLSLVLVMIPLTLQAKSDYWVQFGPEKISLKRIGDGFVNANCQNCQAEKKIKQTIKPDPTTGTPQNPMSNACLQSKGKVRVGKLSNGHSQSFCFFDDGSFVSNNVWKINN